MQYSPERRTALVLCGTGAHGAYHAGVLRALQEAGVKIDVVAGQGVGAGAALLAAIDGGPRLWEPGGVWRAPQTRPFYGWTRRARTAAWLAVMLLLALAAPLGLQLAGVVVSPDSRVAAALLGVIVLSVGMAVLVSGWRPWAGKRRADGGWWWGLVGAPLDANPVRRAFSQTIWQLIRGAAQETRPPGGAGRRYAEVLAENLGQPGFRELMIIATDLDARSDVIAAMLAEPYRHDFIAPRPGRERRAEVLDLSSAGRDHALDIMGGAMTPPSACEPWLLTFGADGYWRGETHRLCDRPGSIARLLEELSAAGVSQVIIATAVTPVGTPHQLRTTHRDPRGRLGEFVVAAEAAALSDALALARFRFDSFYVISPSHNPVGPFDFTGAYDEASDRRHSTAELMEGAYEDAYRQFIEPVVGASGEHLAQATGRAGASAGHAHGQGIFNDADPQR